MTLIGMNPGEVRQLAEQLRRGGEHLRSIVSAVDMLVRNSSWNGRDAELFKHQWWPGRRSSLLGAAEALQGLAQSARHNADEQERVSADSGATGAVAVNPGGSAPASGDPLAGGLAVAGRFVQGMKDQFEDFGRAKTFAELIDGNFLRNPNNPVSNLMHDVLKDGRIRFIGHALDAVFVGAQGLETAVTFRSGDYYEGGLDAIDTVAEVAKTRGSASGPVSGFAFYVGGYAAETWTDVLREARKIDWNLSGDQYGQYINPFVAENWTRTILPGAAEGPKRTLLLMWDNV